MAELSSRDWLEHALASLRSAGYRSGGARKQVVELLARRHCALSALEIDAHLKGVGRASVYRALDQLDGLGLVNRVEMGSGEAGFERAEPGGEHHHHMLCERCGRLIPFEDRALERAISAIARGSSFEVAGHDVTLRGTCGRCGKGR
jgi:Fur family ferric uptake transcriptional regulator